MKILYALQGTGNGHVARSREIIPLLKQYGEVDVFISGTQVDFGPGCDVAFHKYGLSFDFDKKGGIGYLKSMRGAKPLRFIRDVLDFPIEQYDLVVNDFEPVTAWAAWHKKKSFVAMGHQVSYLSDKSPRPASVDTFGEFILKRFIPKTSSIIGFHFEQYDSFIQTPVIRSEIRQANNVNKGHYIVYLPAYHEQYFIPHLKQFPSIRWEVFTKHSKSSYVDGNVAVQPINNDGFVKSLASCHGFLSGGGFEAPAEALYLNKKVMVIPMKGQYEQLCNATAINKLGVTMLLNINKDFSMHLLQWIDEDKRVYIDFEDKTAEIVSRLIDERTSTLHEFDLEYETLRS